MALPEEMTCKELVELVTDYLEGVLPPHDRVRFEDHLKQCEGCETYLDQMRSLIRTLGKLSEDSIPAAARQTLEDAFRSWKRTQSS
jgi:predicted anti-sigma-YlaC factor YlaD